MDYGTLTGTLKAIGKPTFTVEMPGGTRILLLPHGGRVLGLFGAGDEENYYWTNPALASAATAETYYGSGDWQNSGGDRTWLALELDLFFPKYPDTDFSGYVQPRQLDPGNYKIEEVDGTVRMVNLLSVELYRAKTSADLEMRKWVTPAANPLRYEKNLPMPSGVVYAGYTQHTALAMLGGDAARVGLWNLIQMPHRGLLTIPLYARSEPRIYFGTIEENALRVNQQAIRWRMAGKEEQKIGVRATAITGRVGYVYKAGETATLIVRNIAVNPSGDYVDVPYNEPGDLGYCVQACNVNSKWGEFSELEYHVPAIGAGTGRDSCEDVSQVWAFRGPAGAIDEVMAALLGTEK